MRLHTYRVPDTGTISTCPGSPIETIYTPSFNGSEIVLSASGTVDVQESINSFAPYTDIRYMLNQLKVGDTSVLASSQPLFGDFSGMPVHPVDAINLISDVKRCFDTLPEDAKADCNNDWRVYFTRLFTSPADDSTVVPDNVQDSDSSDSDSAKE